MFGNAFATDFAVSDIAIVPVFPVDVADYGSVPDEVG